MKRAIYGTVLVSLLGLGLMVIRPLEAQVPSAGGALLSNTIIRIAGVWLNDKILWSNVRPATSAGFGSGSVSSNNGNATFRVLVGTAALGSTGTITFGTNPPAGTNWNCEVTPMSTPDGYAMAVHQTGGTTNTATFAGVRDDGAAGNFKPGSTLIFHCAGT